MNSSLFHDILKNPLRLALVLGCFILFTAGCANMSKPTIGISGYDETQHPGRH